MCNWCKGKGVPSHRPQNCRDRANRASRFYEAPSAEQEQEDTKAKKAKKAAVAPQTVSQAPAPFLFGGGMFGAPPRMELDFVNGFMGSNYQRPAATPFTFTPAPLVSAFPPGGCSAVPFKPKY